MKAFTVSFFLALQAIVMVHALPASDTTPTNGDASEKFISNHNLRTDIWRYANANIVNIRFTKDSTVIVVIHSVGGNRISDEAQVDTEPGLHPTILALTDSSQPPA
ncbi:hypothetical protein JOM56_015288 [Amanita muscaria]